MKTIMGLSGTPASERVHIGFFGRRNAGKSSVINAVTSQKLSIVSDVKGTTTDPVLKTMELLPIGPVVIIDTPGIDDTGELGKMRVEKTYEILGKTDIAVLVIDASEGMNGDDFKMLDLIKQKRIPYIICYNKCDIAAADVKNGNEISVSAKSNENIYELKELIAKQIETDEPKKILGDLISEGDVAVLVVPIDRGAPKGRLILPQQQAIRDLLESGNICVTVKETELEKALEVLGNKVKIVVTDSQAFSVVSKIVPENIPLTSFSILFLRYKGELDIALKGVKKLDSLKNGDTVLICEGCTHHRQCDDIGTVKMPKWIEAYTQKKLNFEFTSGTEFPKDLSKYSLIIHCGGCMLNEREMKRRLEFADSCGIPVTNYGLAIAFMNKILARTVKPLGITL